LGCKDRTVLSSGSSTGFVSVRGPPKRANLALTREDVGTGLAGWSGVGGLCGRVGAEGVAVPGTSGTFSWFIGPVYGS
jgi:hypothetical protein